MIAARGIEGRGEGAARAQLILSKHNQGLPRFVYDTNAVESRHHPYYDAPEDRLAAAGHLVVSKPPPSPSFDPELDFDTDAPIARQLAARGCGGRGDNALFENCDLEMLV